VPHSRWRTQPTRSYNRTPAADGEGAPPWPLCRPPPERPRLARETPSVCPPGRAPPGRLGRPHGHRGARPARRWHLGGGWGRSCSGATTAEAATPRRVWCAPAPTKRDLARLGCRRPAPRVTSARPMASSRGRWFGMKATVADQTRDCGPRGSADCACPIRDGEDGPRQTFRKKS